MRPLRISIVTPSLNQAGFLNEALRSVQQQNYPAAQHLVLDGGSKDQTLDVLRQFENALHSSNFFWRSQPDSGQSAALNEGFRRADGDIVGWLNADDRYRPGCLSQVAKSFEEHPEVDLIYGDYTFMNESGQHLEIRKEIGFSKFILQYHRVLYIPTASTFFRRRIFDQGHFLREDLHYTMDLEFFIRLARSGYRFLHIPQILADFRIHPQSKSVKGMQAQREEHRRVVLTSTSLADWTRSDWVRRQAASLLQVPAGGMRYLEKLRLGCYLPHQRSAVPPAAQLPSEDLP